MIPKIIHQIWVGDKPKPIKLMQTWKDKHPDYKFFEWNNETIKKIGFRCQKQINQMMSAGRYNGVADIIRYEVLYEFGGFVAPADSICLNPINDLLDNEIFCCYENEKVRGNLLSPHLGAMPKNKLLNFIVGVVRNMDDVLYDDVWKVTGNKLLTEAVKLTKFPIEILPSYIFLPEHYTGEVYMGRDKVYARHLWGTTKNINDKLDENG